MGKLREEAAAHSRLHLLSNLEVQGNPFLPAVGLAMGRPNARFMSLMAGAARVGLIALRAKFTRASSPVRRTGSSAQDIFVTYLLVACSRYVKAPAKFGDAWRCMDCFIPGRSKEAST